MGDLMDSQTRPSIALRQVPRHAKAIIANKLAPLLPEHYRTPTTEYARQKALKDLTSALFRQLDRIGVHMLPKHFYTPGPDHAWLRANRAAWDGPAPMAGVHWDLDEQLDWLRATCGPYLHEVIGLTAITEVSRSGLGPGFGPIDAQVLHGVIRSLAPPRLVEIGSGMSTAIIAAAAQANEREGRPGTRITAIDPYPSDQLRRMPGVTVVQECAQRVPAELLLSLGAGDVLFIDSSHAVKVGSEVVRLFLHVIPQFPAGVTIHVHDVSLPYLYPRTVLSDYFGWQESVLLLALMTGNAGLQTLACMSALHYERGDGLMAILPDYRPQASDAGMRTGAWVRRHFPDSMWIRTSAESQVQPAHSGEPSH
jgi:hypothetical protein